MEIYTSFIIDLPFKLPAVFESCLVRFSSVA